MNDERNGLGVFGNVQVEDKRQSSCGNNIKIETFDAMSLEDHHFERVNNDENSLEREQHRQEHAQVLAKVVDKADRLAGVDVTVEVERLGQDAKAVGNVNGRLCVPVAEETDSVGNSEENEMASASDAW